MYVLNFIQFPYIFGCNLFFVLISWAAIPQSLANPSDFYRVFKCVHILFVFLRSAERIWDQSWSVCVCLDWFRDCSRFMVCRPCGNRKRRTTFACEEILGDILDAVVGCIHCPLDVTLMVSWALWANWMVGAGWWDAFQNGFQIKHQK